MTFSEYMDAMRRLAGTTIEGSDENFEAHAPRMIEYAELRIYRDLELLTQRTTENADLSSGSRDTTVPGSIIVVEAVNLITPAATLPDAGTRNPLTHVSLAFLNAVWPTAATTGTPSYYALLSDSAVRLAPTPSAAFKAEFIGTKRPTPLSATNTTTFISNNLPDLFIAASMVFVAGYQRDYGAQADDPKLAMSWEAQYQSLKQGVAVEEARRKGMAA